MNQDADLLAFLLDGEHDPRTHMEIKRKFADLTPGAKETIENSGAFARWKLGRTMDELQKKIAKALFA